MALQLLSKDDCCQALRYLFTAAYDSRSKKIWWEFNFLEFRIKPPLLFTGERDLDDP